MNKIILLVVFLILHSCDNIEKVKVDFEENSFPEEVYFDAKGEEYFNPNLILLNPNFILYHPDSFLIIHDLGAPFLIKIVDMETGVIQEVIRKGRGPHEMLVAWGTRLIDNDVWVFGAQLKKMCRLKVDENRRFYVSDEVSIKDKGVPEVIALSEEMFVGLSSYGDENRLTYYNSRGEIIKRMGQFPPLNNNSSFKVGNSNIFLSAMNSSSSGDKVVLACLNTDIIEIYDVNKGIVKRLHGPEGVQISAKKKDVGPGFMVVTTPKFKSFRKGIWSDDGEFWLPYLGYMPKKGGERSRENIYVKKIFCFDWNGNPVKKIEFSVPFLSFAVNKSEGKIYCLLEEEEPKIIIYSMN